jgi:hypothetical protein
MLHLQATAATDGRALLRMRRCRPSGVADAREGFVVL